MASLGVPCGAFSVCIEIGACLRVQAPACAESLAQRACQREPAFLLSRTKGGRRGILFSLAFLNYALRSKSVG